MKYLTFIVAFLLSQCVGTSWITGEVVRVADGDTFTLLINSHDEVRIRLHGIDCPERGQPYGRVATEHLKTLLAKGDVRVEETDIDRYGRVVGIVYAGGVNVNESLLAAGLAWHYTRYDQNPRWINLEAQARTQRLGLWAERNPVSPWNWRKRK